MRILYVEDEEDIADIVGKALTRAGYTVEVASDGITGWQWAQEGGWSLILLDVMLPEIDGFEICRRLRARRDRTPVLMLTARDATPDEVRGLEMGADDYLPKPFAMEVLIARVRALLRRESVNRGKMIQIRDLTIDLGENTVKRGGVDVSLTRREWNLLALLAAHEGRPVSREMILQRAWDAEERIGSNMVEVYIAHLRKKIDDGAEVKLIRTVHGLGYTLDRPQEDT
jgi:DNA-binding response OmpR family regulator